MKIAIASDHRGVTYKKEVIDYLKSKNYEVIDCSPINDPTDDYPDFAFKIGEGVASGTIDYGILICNTGIGMSIACNKVKGVRCAKVSNEYEAKMTRRDNDANVIALSARTDIEELKKILIIFLTEEFANIDRYVRRIEKINNYDN